MLTPEARKKIWALVLKPLPEILDEHTVANWFSRLRPLAPEDPEWLELMEDRLFIGVASQFCAGYINEHFLTAVSEAMQRAGFGEIEVRFIPCEAVRIQDEVYLAEQERSRAQEPRPERSKSMRKYPKIHWQMTNKAMRDWPGIDRIVKHQGNFAAFSIVSSIIEAIKEGGSKAKDVKRLLYFCGRAGSGKTTLARALAKTLASIWNEAGKGEQKARPIRIISLNVNDWYQKFQAECEAGRRDLPHDNQAHNAVTLPWDIVILDDVAHVGGGRKVSREALLGLVKSIYDSGGRTFVIVTAYCPPHELKGFLETEISLLGSFVIEQLEHPKSPEDCLNFLKSIAGTMTDVEINEDGLKLLTRCLDSNKQIDIRTMVACLDQAINRARALTTAETQVDYVESGLEQERGKVTVTEDVIRQVLTSRNLKDPLAEHSGESVIIPNRKPPERSDRITAVGAIATTMGVVPKQEHFPEPPFPRRITRIDKARTVVDIVAQQFKVSPSTMTARKGWKRLPTMEWPERVCIYLCRLNLGLDYPQMARLFGRNDAEVITAISEMTKELKDERSPILRQLTNITKEHRGALEC